jgi:ferredoxin--NADP+ reductase
MSSVHPERVLEVKHWTETLFSFRTTRNRAFRFDSGQFVMMGLPVEGRNLLRAYSLASAQHEEELEFFSIKVPNGPLTSLLQKISVGDTVLVGAKATGTLVHHSLLPGKRLHLLSTGTGIAPFASLIKDPSVYELYQRVYLVHGCRWQRELAYGTECVQRVMADEFLGEMAQGRLVHLPLTTREPSRHQGRITDLMRTRVLGELLESGALDPEVDRVMVCGNPAFLTEVQQILQAAGLREGSSSRPGHYVVERAFVER